MYHYLYLNTFALREMSLRQLSVSLLVCVVAGQFPATILDGHVHITNISLLSYPWAKADAGVCPCAPPCLCNWRLADYVNITSAAPISPRKVVFVEVGANSSDWLSEAQWVHSVANSDPLGSMLGAIIAQQPPGFGSPSVPPSTMASLLDSLVQVGPLVHGIRAGAVLWMEPAAYSTIVQHCALLVSRQLSLEVTTSLATPGFPSLLSNLTRDVPGLTLILDHLGGPPVLGNETVQAGWYAGVATVASLPGVYMKVGGILQGWKSTGVLPTLVQVQPWVEYAVRTMGYSRTIYEGNWFFCDWYAPANLDVYWLWAGYVLDVLDALSAQGRDRQLLFWQTGATAYRVQQ